MKVGNLTLLFVCCAQLALASPAAGPAAYRPKWAVGDWWTVDSQIYDRAENLPGGTPHWLEIETWKFAVDATNSVDGQPCYEVSVRPTGQNRCPYWFSYFFRESDLLVMRRQLHQPGIGKSSRAPSEPTVETTFSKDEEVPFVQADFPNLPVAIPHFGGTISNAYRQTSTAAKHLDRAANSQAHSRLFAGAVNQTFDANAQLQKNPPAGRRSAKVVAVNNTPNSGVIKISLSNDKQEKQEWNAKLPWPAYAEKWEFGELVRKSWLTDFGHSDAANTAKAGAAQ